MAANMQASFSTRVGYGGRGWAYGSPSSSELQARARCSSVRRGPASSVGFPGLLGEGQAQVQVVFMGSSWFLQVWLASLSFFTSGLFPDRQPCWPTAKLCPPPDNRVKLPMDISPVPITIKTSSAHKSLLFHITRHGSAS